MLQLCRCGKLYVSGYVERQVDINSVQQVTSHRHQDTTDACVAHVCSRGNLEYCMNSQRSAEGNAAVHDIADGASMTLLLIVRKPSRCVDRLPAESLRAAVGVLGTFEGDHLT